ncbi:MAG: SPFH domain-containing protein [Polyangiales bacterium]
MTVVDEQKSAGLDVVQWAAPAENVLAYRHPAKPGALVAGTQVVVRAEQAVLFVDSGQPVDVFGVGTHALCRENLPLSVGRNGSIQPADGPYALEIFFHALQPRRDQSWATPEPLACHDPELGPMQLRLSGVHGYAIRDVRAFHREVAHARERFTSDDLLNQLQPLIISAAGEFFVRNKQPLVTLVADLGLLSSKLRDGLREPFARLGLALEQFTVESVRRPDDAPRLSSTPTLAPPAAALTRCSACGAQREPASTFCVGCGHKIA